MAPEPLIVNVVPDRVHVTLSPQVPEASAASASSESVFAAKTDTDTNAKTASNAYFQFITKTFSYLCGGRIRLPMSETGADTAYKIPILHAAPQYDREHVPHRRPAAAEPPERPPTLPFPGKNEAGTVPDRSRISEKSGDLCRLQSCHGILTTRRSPLSRAPAERLADVCGTEKPSSPPSVYEGKAERNPIRLLTAVRYICPPKKCTFRITLDWKIGYGRRPSGRHRNAGVRGSPDGPAIPIDF